MESRCATIIDVVPKTSFLIAFCIMSAVSVFTLELASSKINILGAKTRETHPQYRYVVASVIDVPLSCCCYLGIVSVEQPGINCIPSAFIVRTCRCVLDTRGLERFF